MADEIKKEEQKPEDKKVEPTEELSVEIDGIWGKFKVEDAKKLIESRDNKHRLIKEITVAKEKAEKEKEEIKKQSEMKTLALEGKIAEITALASKQSDEKLAVIQNRIVTKEIETALLQDESFIKESLPDAIALLKGQHTFKLSEDGEKVIAEDGKDAGEVAREWLKKKEIFRKGSGITPTGGKLNPTTKKIENSGEYSKFVKGIFKK